MNSAGRELLAWIPPTRAAARKIASGFLAAIHASVSTWRVRSTSPRPAVSTSQSTEARRRTIAAPTMPRWPATQTRLPASGKRLPSIVGVLLAMEIVLPLHLLEIGPHHVAHQLGE